MDLGILVEIVVQYLIIGKISCRGHRDRFSTVSALLYVIDSTSSKSLCKEINCHDSPDYVSHETLNLERMVSLCQNRYEV